MSNLINLVEGIVIILAVGFIAEKVMEKKGKGKSVKNVNYYLRLGNTLPIAILKAIGAGYVWLFKTYIKVIIVAILSIFGVSDPRKTDEEQAEEDAMYYMHMQEEEKWKN